MNQREKYQPSTRATRILIDAHIVETAIEEKIPKKKTFIIEEISRIYKKLAWFTSDNHLTMDEYANVYRVYCICNV